MQSFLHLGALSLSNISCLFSQCDLSLCTIKFCFSHKCSVWQSTAPADNGRLTFTQVCKATIFLCSFSTYPNNDIRITGSLVGAKAGVCDSVAEITTIGGQLLPLVRVRQGEINHQVSWSHDPWAVHTELSKRKSKTIPLQNSYFLSFFFSFFYITSFLLCG